METFRGDETIERSESFVSFRFMDPVLRYAEAHLRPQPRAILPASSRHSQRLLPPSFLLGLPFSPPVEQSQAAGGDPAPAISSTSSSKDADPAPVESTGCRGSGRGGKGRGGSQRSRKMAPRPKPSFAADFLTCVASTCTGAVDFDCATASSAGSRMGGHTPKFSISTWKRTIPKSMVNW
jgi:hypothetical protein